MTSPLHPLKILLLSQLAVGVLLTLVLLAATQDFQLGASFALGAAIMLLNLVALAWGWWRVLAQKTIAWTVLIIVIKYAVLLGAIFYLSRQPWFQIVGAGLGVASFLVALMLMAALSREKEKA